MKNRLTDLLKAVTERNTEAMVEALGKGLLSVKDLDPMREDHRDAVLTHAMNGHQITSTFIKSFKQESLVTLAFGERYHWSRENDNTLKEVRLEAQAHVTNLAKSLKGKSKADLLAHVAHLKARDRKTSYYPAELVQIMFEHAKAIDREAYVRDYQEFFNRDTQSILDKHHAEQKKEAEKAASVNGQKVRKPRGEPIIKAIDKGDLEWLTRLKLETLAPKRWENVKEYWKNAPHARVRAHMVRVPESLVLKDMDVAVAAVEGWVEDQFRLGMSWDRVPRNLFDELSLEAQVDLLYYACKRTEKVEGPFDSDEVLQSIILPVTISDPERKAMATWFNGLQKVRKVLKLSKGVRGRGLSDQEKTTVQVLLSAAERQWGNENTFEGEPVFSALLDIAVEHPRLCLHLSKLKAWKDKADYHYTKEARKPKVIS